MEENKEEDGVMFAVVYTNGGQPILGQVSAKAMAAWTLHQAKLVIQNPASLMIRPKVQGDQIIGHEMGVAPLHPIKTKQIRIVIEPSYVEVIGEVTQNEYGVYNCTDAPADIFNAYTDLIKNWKAEVAGIVAPTPLDMANLSNAGNPPLPFNPNRRPKH